MSFKRTVQSLPITTDTDAVEHVVDDISQELGLLQQQRFEMPNQYGQGMLEIHPGFPDLWVDCCSFQLRFTMVGQNVRQRQLPCLSESSEAAGHSCTNGSKLANTLRTVATEVKKSPLLRCRMINPDYRLKPPNWTFALCRVFFLCWWCQGLFQFWMKQIAACAQAVAGTQCHFLCGKILLWWMDTGNCLNEWTIQSGKKMFR